MRKEESMVFLRPRGDEKGLVRLVKPRALVRGDVVVLGFLVSARAVAAVVLVAVMVVVFAAALEYLAGLGQ